jgi:hypothetical protein
MSYTCSSITRLTKIKINWVKLTSSLIILSSVTKTEINLDTFYGLGNIVVRDELLLWSLSEYITSNVHYKHWHARFNNTEV